MAHIHLEDGSFPLFWVIVWWIAALILTGISLYILRQEKKPGGKTITIAAFCTAAAFAIFQVSIPVFGGIHLNLTPLISILTGPVIGSLVVLTINIFSAGIGHGGWGMVGANTLTNIAEIAAAYSIWWILKPYIPDLFFRAGIASFVALFAGNVTMIAIILVSGIQGVTQEPAQLLYGLSLLAAINMGVAVIEALVTGLIVAYIGKARPDMLGGGWP